MKGNAYIQLLWNRSFMSFWCATTLMLLASNVLQFALAVYVLDLTGSAFVYSTVLSIIILPRILCTSFAGHLADLKDSIRILRWGTLGLTSLMALFLAVHGLIHPLDVPLIYALVISLELCETFLSPAEGKALLSVVTEEEIAPASKLSSLDDGIVELLSPAIGALCYSCFGMTGVLGICLLMEGTSFLLTAKIRCRRMSSTEDAVPAFSLSGTFTAYHEAFLSLRKHPYLIAILLFAPLFNFFIGPLFSVTVPHYFRVTMSSGVDMYALSNMVLGAAGLMAPFIAMLLIRDGTEHKANLGGTAASAASLLGLIAILHFGEGRISAEGTLYAVTAFMAALVTIITIINIAASIITKKYIPEQLMGRMLSMIQLCAEITIPLGQLFYGLCADKAPITVSLWISVFGLVLTLAIMSRAYSMLGRK